MTRPAILSGVMALAAGFAAIAQEPDFTVVLLPDTQKYAELYPEIFFAQTQWIRDHAAAENIVFVSQLGDIVEHGGFGENGNAAEWEVAAGALGLLDGAAPWGLVIGNHDFDTWYDPLAGSQNFLQRFGPPRFTDQPWFGDWSPDGYNSYQYFVGGGRRFLVLHLIPDIPPAAMSWAQAVLDAHPDTPALISTHIYMKATGRTLFPYMDMYDPAWNGHSGEEIFQLLVAPNPQVFMVNCGHVSLERFQTSLNQAGQPVFELLQDYQLRQWGGQGFLRILRFRPVAGVIEVRTYSPWLDQFETDADSQFDIALDFLERLGPAAGDLNCDGSAGFDDINPFVLALLDADAYATQFPACRRTAADCNLDGVVGFDDINAFVALLAD